MQLKQVNVEDDSRFGFLGSFPHLLRTYNTYLAKFLMLPYVTVGPKNYLAYVVRMPSN